MTSKNKEKKSPEKNYHFSHNNRPRGTKEANKNPIPFKTRNNLRPISPKKPFLSSGSNALFKQMSDQFILSKLKPVSIQIDK